MSATVHRRSPTRKEFPSPRRRNSPHHGRSPDHRRILTRDASPVRNNSSHRAMSPPKEKLHDRAQSSNDVGSRNSRKEKVPELSRSPRRRDSRSPTKVKLRHHNRSPVHPRSRSPIRTESSRSPSPRTKRLRRAEANRGLERLVDIETEKSYSRENTKGRQKERSDGRDLPQDRRTVREKVDIGTSRIPRHGRSNSPDERSHRSRYGSRSPSTAARILGRELERGSRDAGPNRGGVEDSVSMMNATQEALETKEKQKPSFELSGKLAEETNRVRGVTLLFTEPPDARKPDVRWRLYVFKGGEVLNDPLYVHRQSCYLFGRERRVADIPTDHPSCSKQHAVLQYRIVEREQADGMMKKQVRPYLMDLGSTNGTFINDNRVEPQRYYELFEKDTIKFGNSSREYVLLHENSVQ